jgi:hypothetical protein
VVSNHPASKTALRRGYARMIELAQQNKAKRDALAAELLGGLGRPPSAIDRVAAENLASMVVQADRLEAHGKDASELRRQINQAMRTSGFKPAMAEPPKQPSIAELLAARGYAPPSARSGAEAPEQQETETRTSEAASEAAP